MTAGDAASSRYAAVIGIAGAVRLLRQQRRASAAGARDGHRW